MKDEPLKICPECGQEIRRVINGGSGIIFKGSGFYVTDKTKKSDSKAKETKTSGTEGACPGCVKPDTSTCPNAVNS